MFSERKERLDWQLVAEVEPLVVEAGFVGLREERLLLGHLHLFDQLISLRRLGLGIQ